MMAVRSNLRPATTDIYKLEQQVTMTILSKYNSPVNTTDLVNEDELIDHTHCNDSDTLFLAEHSTETTEDNHKHPGN